MNKEQSVPNRIARMKEHTISRLHGFCRANL